MIFDNIEQVTKSNKVFCESAVGYHYTGTNIAMLDYQRIGWTSVTVLRERSVLISIVTSVAECNATYSITVRINWIWSEMRGMYDTIILYTATAITWCTMIFLFVCWSKTQGHSMEDKL